MATRITERPLTDCTDRELLARFVSRGEEDAFGQLVKRHGPLILGVCRRMLMTEQDAEDVFQATFLALARHAKRKTWQLSVAGWLYKVAHRDCLRLRTQNANRRTFALEAETMIECSQLEEVASQEAQEQLHAEVLALPRKYRDTLILCCLEGMPREQAARELDCSVIDIKNRLQRGRQELLLRLGMRGVVLSAALASLEGTVAAAQNTLSDSLVTTTTQAAVAHAAGHLSLQSYLPQQAAASKGAVHAMLKTYLVRTLLVATMSTAALSAGMIVVLGASPEQPGDSWPLDTAAILGDSQTQVLAFAAADDPNVQTDPSRQNTKQANDGVSAKQSPKPSPSGEEKIRVALEKPTQLDFIATPLTDVIDFLKDAHDIPMHLDERALDAEGVATDSPITMQLSGVKLGSVMDLMLEPLGLTTVIKDDVVVVTTETKASTMIDTRIYDVAELLDRLQISSKELADGIPHPGGMVELRSLGTLLIARQTQKAHAELQQLLDKLGKQRISRPSPFFQPPVRRSVPAPDLPNSGKFNKIDAAPESR